MPPVRAGLRHVAARLVHPLHRRRARAALQERARPAVILVVCHGNICRSPFAAARLARALQRAAVRVESAGFVGPDRACPPEAVTAAAQWGEDLSAHRSTLLTADRVRSADLIVAMDPSQGRAIWERFGRSRGDIVVLGDLDPAVSSTRAIRDPVEQGIEVFIDSYARIARCVEEFVAVLALAPGPAATVGDRSS